MGIPEPELAEEESSIPSSVAGFSEEIEPEMHPYLISFSKYNTSMCQLEGGFEHKQRKDSLNLLKKIGMKVLSKSDISTKLGVTIKPVINDGDYSDLYRGLDESIQVEEAYLSNNYTEKGRLFFFTIDTEKIFYCLAFKNTHIDTTKNYRK